MRGGSRRVCEANQTRRHPCPSPRFALPLPTHGWATSPTRLHRSDHAAVRLTCSIQSSPVPPARNRRVLLLSSNSQPHHLQPTHRQPIHCSGSKSHNANIPRREPRTLSPHLVPHRRCDKRQQTTSRMRPALAPLFLAPLAALAASDRFAAFEPALEQLPAAYNETEAIGQDGVLELLKRQNGNACATNYFACSNLGAPGLCCPRSAVCSADQRGAVACCPQGVACTGALSTGLATASVNPTATTTGSFVPASTTTDPFSQGTGGASPGSTLRVPPLIQAVKAMLQSVRLL
ncbi:hypothetical protein NX059_006711 [Plenodomus lindquistii]|nr:hypothetical protein NX059_006711 [Plenodomus lindquistii]